MHTKSGMGRRDVLRAGALGLGASALTFSGCVTLRGAGSGRAGSTPQRFFEALGVDEALIRAGLSAALSTGADRADLYFQHRLINNVTLEDGAVNRAYSEIALGVGVRAIKGDQTGFAYTEELTVESIQTAGRTAAAVAASARRPLPERFHVTTGLPQRYPVALRWEDVRASRKLPLLEAAHRRALEADPRIIKANVSMSDESSTILLATSDGRLIEDVQPMTTFSLSCVAEQQGRREENNAYVAARSGFEFYDDARLDRVVQDAVGRTLVLFEAAPAPVGEMPVVLAAGASGILLHEAIGHGMEADFNRKGTSIFSDRINKPVAHPFVSIVDEGTKPHARGSINVDDEGNAAGTTYLVQEGTLTTYLHDSISAQHYGVTPTGNGRRQSYAHAPMPRMRSTYMLPGPHRRDEIIASVKRGIYCETFTNGQVNIGPGDFTFYVKNGRLIEDGKLTRPIKDVNLIGNGPKVLEKIDMVADDLVIDDRGWTCGKDGQMVAVSLGIPTVRVASLTVGGKGA